MDEPHFPAVHRPTQRRAVTVAAWAKRPDYLLDAAAYWFRPDSEALGLDPWRVIDGVDAHMTGDAFDVWFASGTCAENIPGEKTIYVSETHYRALTA